MVRLQMNFRYSETCQIKMPNKEIKIHTYLSNHYNTMESSFPLYLWLWDKRIRRIGHVHFKFSSLQILNFLTKDALKCRSKNDGDIFHHFWWILCKTRLPTILKQANHREMQWHASWMCDRNQVLVIRNRNQGPISVSVSELNFFSETETSKFLKFSHVFSAWGI